MRASTGRVYQSQATAQVDAEDVPSAQARRGGGGNGGGGNGGRRGPGGNGKRPRRRWRRVLIITSASLAILVGIALIGGYVLINRVQGNVGRIDNAFAGLDEKQRPQKPVATKNSQTFLLLGSDSRDPNATTGSSAKDPSWRPGEQRTDTIMIMHIPADRHSAQVVSVPRDSWVDIPGKGKMKINAAYSLGGPSLLIRTVEQLTQVRIDHFAVVDFAGFTSIIDSLGGIDVQVSEDTTDQVGNHFHKGINHLNGTQALFYVRQRHGLPGSDFDRVKRQQNLLRAVMAKMSGFDPAKDPIGAFHLMDSLTKAISVDSQLSNSEMRSLAFDVPGIRSGGITYLTAPVKGTGMEGDQSVVYLDPTASPELWNAINNDSVPAYASAHSKDLLPAVPR
ncbi:LCP family protein [Planosporangium thailandense]|uniref:LCP family protein n=1 Tax=Planosporangium thailandense TaxID=765197 RepID=A0ABX0Y826_9ACTN|nr:LCP family protein [Planosporangium thailandense]NJC74287.1 LCP family protein [Planosporangium thailandense]